MDKEFDHMEEATKNIKIHWVRHAESCSNVELHGLNGGAGWISKTASAVKDIVDVTIQKTSQPPLTELGIYQAIILGDFIDSEYDGYYTSPSTRTILTLMLALESKYRKNPKAEIPVIIVENIIELQNIAGSIGQDKQNEALKPYNLKIIINYLRNWLNYNFFNYFANVDKKFMELHTRIYEKIKNFYSLNSSNSLISDIIIQLEKIDSCLSVNSEERKIDTLASVISLINRNVPRDIVLLEEIDELAYYLKLDRFDFVKFKILRLPTSPKKINDMQQFILHLLDESRRPNEKFLCLSHGSLLKKYFKLSRKLYNTEMVEQNCSLINLDSGNFKTDINLVSREKIVEIDHILRQIQKCDKICGMPKYIRVDEARESNKLFGIISKMSMYDEEKPDPIIEDEIDPKFRVPSAAYNLPVSSRNEYFKKYLSILK